MNRRELETYIAQTYSTDAEYPWAAHPGYAVFRHSGNRKWFAVTMDIPREKLGMQGDGMIAVLNVKCGPVLTGSLLTEAGFFPAYHMSKTNWVSIALDGTVSAEEIQWLLETSYDLAAPRRKARKDMD